MTRVRLEVIPVPLLLGIALAVLLALTFAVTRHVVAFPEFAPRLAGAGEHGSLGVDREAWMDVPISQTLVAAQEEDRPDPTPLEQVAAWRLVAVEFGGDGPCAFVDVGEAALRRLRVGDEYQGHRLLAIEPTGVRWRSRGDGSAWQMSLQEVMQ